MRSLKKILFLVLFTASFTGNAQFTNFRHDYSQTLVMKLVMSVPDGEGGSKVFNTFESALEIIKTTNHLSLGIPKIIYLVGWQYNGHDDKYPAFFEVNKYLKRSQDISARESLLWLMREAKKYNTIVSLHINMTDAYEDSPLWEEYVEKDMISKTASGKLMVIGRYNNRKAYQINYRNEWENGYAQMRIDKLLRLLPLLKEAGTIHLDAWIVRESKGHYESAVTEAKYQKKILEYWNQKGIDVTSEWVMDYMIGKVPFAWHFNHMKQSDYLKIPAKIYTGSGLNPDVRNTDFGLGFLFGKSMYGETVFPSLLKEDKDEEWIRKFNKDFYLNVLQYNYLNRSERLKIEGEGNNRTAYFSGDVKTSLKDSTVVKGNYVLRKKGIVVFPVLWKQEKNLAVYSQKELLESIELPPYWNDVKKVSIYRVTAEGNKLLKNTAVKGNRISFRFRSATPYLIRPKIYK